MLDSDIYDCQIWMETHIARLQAMLLWGRPMQQVVVSKHPYQEPSPAWQSEPSVEIAPTSLIPSEMLPKAQADFKFKKMSRSYSILFCFAPNDIDNPYQ